MSLTKQDLEKIRVNLILEDKQTLSSEFKITIGSVRNILGGRAQNDALVERATELALKRKSLEAERISKIQKAIKAL